jgi:hypothetical protein
VTARFRPAAACETEAAREGPGGQGAARPQAAANSRLTWLAMPANSGMAANRMPTQGTGSTVGLFGSAVWIERRLIAANGTARPAGIASARARSQSDRLPRPVSGASAKPTLSASVGAAGLVTKDAANVASIHMPHLPCWNSDGFSLKLLVAWPTGPASVIMPTKKPSVSARGLLSNRAFHALSNQRAPDALAAA